MNLYAFMQMPKSKHEQPETVLIKRKNAHKKITVMEEVFDNADLNPELDSYQTFLSFPQNTNTLHILSDDNCDESAIINSEIHSVMSSNELNDTDRKSHSQLSLLSFPRGEDGDGENSNINNGQYIFQSTQSDDDSFDLRRTQNQNIDRSLNFCRSPSHTSSTMFPLPSFCGQIHINGSLVQFWIRCTSTSAQQTDSFVSLDDMLKIIDPFVLMRQSLLVAFETHIVHMNVAGSNPIALVTESGLLEMADTYSQIYPQLGSFFRSLLHRLREETEMHRRTKSNGFFDSSPLCGNDSQNSLNSLPAPFRGVYMNQTENADSPLSQTQYFGGFNISDTDTESNSNNDMIKKRKQNSSDAETQSCIHSKYKKKEKIRKKYRKREYYHPQPTRGHLIKKTFAFSTNALFTHVKSDCQTTVFFKRLKLLFADKCIVNITDDPETIYEKI